MESTEIGRLNVIEESFDDWDDEDEGPDEDHDWYWENATLLLKPPAGSGRTIVDELVGVLRKVTEFGCYCVIVSPAKADDDSRVFVQCIATPAGFHIEAVSNVFLWEKPEKLDDQQHALLEALGWTEPTVPYDPADRPEDWATTGDFTRNWWAAAGGDDAAERTAAFMLHTLISVYRIGGEPELEVRTFEATQQDYFWDEEAGELGWGVAN
jgi:hypothetical protein